MKIIMSALIVALTLISAPAFAKMETYKFDLGHTELIFSYRHLGMSRSYVQFKGIDGVLKMDVDAPEKSSIDVTIDTKSVDTGLAVFDKHIQGKDFFDTEKFPKATFKSTKVDPAGGKKYKIYGDLTIKGKTLPVVLDTTFIVAQPHPLGVIAPKYKDTYVAAFSARTTIKRSDFGMGKFAPATSDKVEIIIETEMFRQ